MQMFRIAGGAVFALCLGMTALANRANAQQIAITWDDLPAHGRLPQGETRAGIGRKLLAAMQDARMPSAYGFVNGIQIERDPASLAMLKDWREAGMLLGNHAWSHVNLNERTLEQWEADVIQNEPLVESTMKGQDWHWLRFPNLGEGETPAKRAAARAFLAGRGYKIAGVTMSFEDWSFTEPYARCTDKHDEPAIAKLEAAYLAAADARLGYTRGMAKTLYGHDIPYILLMHVGPLDARVLSRLLALYRQRGVTFLSLEDAVKDPFYRNDVDLSLSPEPDTLEEAVRARKLPVPAPPAPTIDLDTICK